MVSGFQMYGGKNFGIRQIDALASIGFIFETVFRPTAKSSGMTGAVCTARYGIGRDVVAEMIGTTGIKRMLSSAFQGGALGATGTFTSPNP